MQSHIGSLGIRHKRIWDIWSQWLSWQSSRAWAVIGPEMIHGVGHRITVFIFTFMSACNQGNRFRILEKGWQYITHICDSVQRPVSCTSLWSVLVLSSIAYLMSHESNRVRVYRLGSNNDLWHDPVPEQNTWTVHSCASHERETERYTPLLSRSRPLFPATVPTIGPSISIRQWWHTRHFASWNIV